MGLGACCASEHGPFDLLLPSVPVVRHTCMCKVQRPPPHHHHQKIAFAFILRLSLDYKVMKRNKQPKIKTNQIGRLWEVIDGTTCWKAVLAVSRNMNYILIGTSNVKWVRTFVSVYNLIVQAFVRVYVCASLNVYWFGICCGCSWDPQLSSACQLYIHPNLPLPTTLGESGISPGNWCSGSVMCNWSSCHQLFHPSQLTLIGPHKVQAVCDCD